MRSRGLIGELASSLLADAARLDPTARIYSPYGLTYGFAADLLRDMAIATLVAQPSFGLSLEAHVREPGPARRKARARTRGWTALPRRSEERPHGDHSDEWAQRIFTRLVHALEARAARPRSENASDRRDAKLFVVPESPPAGFLPEQSLPAGPSPRRIIATPLRSREPPRLARRCGRDRRWRTTGRKEDSWRVSRSTANGSRSPRSSSVC